MPGKIKKKQDKTAAQTSQEPKVKIEDLISEERIDQTKMRFTKWGTEVVEDLDLLSTTLEKNPPRTLKEVESSLRAAKAAEKKADTFLDGWMATKGLFAHQMEMAGKMMHPVEGVLREVTVLIQTQITGLHKAQKKLTVLRSEYEGLAQGKW